jgi:hypothetical protein
MSLAPPSRWSVVGSRWCDWSRATGRLVSTPWIQLTEGALLLAAGVISPIRQTHDSYEHALVALRLPNRTEGDAACEGREGTTIDDAFRLLP